MALSTDDLVRLGEEEEVHVAIDNTMCPSCGVSYANDNDRLVCPKCGKVNKDVTVCDEHPPQTCTTASVRAYGPNAPSIRKILASESVINDYKDRNDVAKYPFDADILVSASKLYDKVKETKTSTSMRKELMAACLSWACKTAHKARPDAEIAGFIGLQTSTLTAGNAILMDLHIKGIIVAFPNYNPSADYTNLLMERIPVDKKYAPFTMSVLMRAEELGVGQDSGALARCAGSLWITNETFVLAIPMETFEAHVRKQTIMKFVNNILRYKSHFVPLYAAFIQAKPKPSD